MASCVFIDWKDHKFPLPPNQSMAPPDIATSTCSVRMDLYGDRTSMLPRDNDAQYTFYDYLEKGAPDPLRSKECE